MYYFNRRSARDPRESGRDIPYRGFERRTYYGRYGVGGLPELPDMHRDVGGGHRAAVRVPGGGVRARAPRPAPLRHYAVHLVQPQGMVYSFKSHQSL